MDNLPQSRNIVHPMGQRRAGLAGDPTIRGTPAVEGKDLVKVTWHLEPMSRRRRFGWEEVSTRKEIRSNHLIALILQLTLRSSPQLRLA